MGNKSKTSERKVDPVTMSKEDGKKLCEAIARLEKEAMDNLIKSKRESKMHFGNEHPVRSTMPVQLKDYPEDRARREELARMLDLMSGGGRNLHNFRRI